MSVVAGPFPANDRHSAPRDQRMRHMPVSTTSAFGDDLWCIELTTAGAGVTVTLAWNLDPPRPGRPGVDLDQHAREWADILVEGKRLIWAMLRGRHGRLKWKPESLRSVYYPLLFAMRWASAKGLASLLDFTPNQAQLYLDDLEWEKVTGAEEPVKHGTITNYVKILYLIHEHRWSIAAGRDGPKVQHPFPGCTVGKVAAGIVKNKKRGWIPPVPDPVWLPVVKTAMAWLDGPALHLAAIGPIIARHLDGATSVHLTDQSLWLAIQASGGGAVTAWLEAEAALAFQHHSTADRLPNGRLLRLYRALMSDLRDACTIVFQGMLGLRISEVAGLVSFPTFKVNGWPQCVRVEPSRTGLNEIFYVHGHVYKGKRRPTPADWIAGTRPLGTDHVPIAIKAILALDDAFRPWRLAREHERLLVPMDAVPGSRSGRDVLDEVLSSALNRGQKEFIARRVTLPPAHQAWRLSTHQWRKSFALHMVRADESLLGAVSEHFKHLNVAATEQGYVGRDTEMLEFRHDAGLQEMAWSLYEAASGKATVAGPMAETVLGGAKEVVDGGETPEDGLHRLTKLLKDSNARVATAPWGRCLFRPELAQCRPDEDSRSRRPASGPDYANRHPGLCCTCGNVLMTEGHRDFWRGRLRENLAIRREARALDDKASAAVAKTRALQSWAVLRKLRAGARNRTERTNAGV